MSEMQHPLKKEMDKIATLINELQHLYGAYFQGVEKNPPRNKRKELEDKILWIRAEVAKKNSAALNFHIRQLEARYQMIKNRWDKTLSEIESGIYRIPSKRR